MAFVLLFIPLLFSSALAYSCQSYTIPLKNISAPSFELSFEIKNQWDITDWTVNEARRDSATAFNGIAGPSSVVGDFDISARFCTPSNATELAQAVLVMTHGLGADKTYWDPTFEGGDKYSLLHAAVSTGYSVFHYDRLGTGNSTKADPHTVVQFPVQVEILASLTRLLLQPNSTYTMDVSIKSAVHFGHSYGSYITAALASAHPELTQAISLSGYSGVFDFFNILIAGWQSRVAALLDPARWGHLPHGYVTPVDLHADSYLEFKAPYFDHRVAEWGFSVKSPYAVGELATLGQTPYDTTNFTKPVQASLCVYQGRYDLSACGGNCDGVLNRTALLWPQANPLDISGTFPAGHSVNLHFNSSLAFAAMLDFVRKNT
ncbi:Alpha/Beta hydrolase protein [Roridomyces roridus]|uniref:Alpha/Beta hydrolase protein n=1 Tax=Roridomyces roridus TaxID=1738132 RepID=A0AAD7C9U4_9AGAR|nr:Alpha/Beta hydrolase protein [Roridomyces roridus]